MSIIKDPIPWSLPIGVRIQSSVYPPTGTSPHDVYKALLKLKKEVKDATK